MSNLLTPDNPSEAPVSDASETRISSTGYAVVSLPIGSTADRESAGQAAEEAPKAVRLTDSLTGLRFIAAVHVFAYHAWAAKGANVHLRLFEQRGTLPVSLFFVLSGFVLTLTYGRTPKPIDLRGFAVARIARIYPIYALSILAFLPFYLHDYGAHLPGWFLGQNTLLSLLLVQNWSLNVDTVPSGVAWTLCVEALFYALFPFMIPRLSKLAPRSLVGIGIGAWIVSFVVFHPHGLDPSGLIARIPLLRLPEFLIGMVAGRFYLLDRPIRSAIRECMVYGSIALSVAITQAFDFGSNLTGLMVGLFGVLVFALAGSNGLLARFLRTRPMLLLGSASYALYLFHFLVMNLAHLLYGARGIKGDGLAFAVPVALLGVLLSVGVYRFIEEPFREAIRCQLGRPDRAAGHQKVDGVDARRPDAARLASQLHAVPTVGPSGNAVPSSPSPSIA